MKVSSFSKPIAVFFSLGTIVCTSAVVLSQAPTVVQPPPSVVQPPPPQAPTNSPPQPISNIGTRIVCAYPQTLLYPRSSPNTPKVLIEWKTSEFGDNYSPLQRCQIVSQRLQQAVDTNQGSITTLQLQSGNVNGRIVICYAPNGQRCSSANQLLTLKRENERFANDIMKSLVDTKSTRVVYEDDKIVVPLGQFEDASASSGASPSNPTLPD